MICINNEDRYLNYFVLGSILLSGISQLPLKAVHSVLSNILSGGQGRILLSVGQEQHVIRFYVDPGAVCLLTLPELGVGRLVCLGVGKVERLPLRPVARELLRDNAALWGLADNLGLHS